MGGEGSGGAGQGGRGEGHLSHFRGARVVARTMTRIPMIANSAVMRPARNELALPEQAEERLLNAVRDQIGESTHSAPCRSLHTLA